MGHGPAPPIVDRAPGPPDPAGRWRRASSASGSPGGTLPGARAAARTLGLAPRLGHGRRGPAARARSSRVRRPLRSRASPTTTSSAGRVPAARSRKVCAGEVTRSPSGRRCRRPGAAARGPAGPVAGAAPAAGARPRAHRREKCVGRPYSSAAVSQAEGRVAAGAPRTRPDSAPRGWVPAPRRGTGRGSAGCRPRRSVAGVRRVRAHHATCTTEPRSTSSMPARCGRPTAARSRFERSVEGARGCGRRSSSCCRRHARTRRRRAATTR